MAKISGADKSADERSFLNPWSRTTINLAPPDLHARLKEIITANLQQLKVITDDSRNQSVYTGNAGIALLYMHAAYRIHHSTPVPQKQLLERAVLILQPCLSNLNTRRVTYLCGAAGPLALAAHLYHLLGDISSSNQYVCRLKGLSPALDTPDLPSELLYGRAGYLYALLYMGALVPGALDENLIEQQVAAILDAGQQGRKDIKGGPLMYTWHGKHYLGAAHGVAGILTVLLQVRVEHIRSRILSVVEASVDYLLTQLFPSGNLPSSLESAGHDKLVQWCHGAPGFVHLLANAYKTFNKKGYLDAALKCGEVVWERGLLLKGYSLCHGAAGNAYTFLQLYRLTGDQIHLSRAVKFAEWCMSSEERVCSKPDHPYSLFEGLAGVTYLYCDLLAPEKSTFPALELPSPYE